MASIGLFYGTDEGHTEDVSERIQKLFPDGEVEIINIAEASNEDFEEFEILILGTPTLDNGGKQPDWEEFWPNLYSIDFSQKVVALFGLGDQVGYGDYFLDSMGDLAEAVSGQGATVIGEWPIEGYDFGASRALTASADHFVGLAIDEDTQDDETDARCEAWVKQVQAALA